MSAELPIISDKCRGAMVASAIGDALGWPNEPRSGNTSKNKKGSDCFVSWKRKSGVPYFTHVEDIDAGEYSDDTQMILSVARSIIAGNWEDFFARKELPFWTEYQRGGGKALLKAARFYKKGKDIWQSKEAEEYFNAGGNGGVMRILPHVITVENHGGGTALMEEAVKDCIITHGHPRAILGTTCYAYALNYLLRKNSVLEFGELVSSVIGGSEVWGRFPDALFASEWLECANACYDFKYEWDKTLNNMLSSMDFISNSLKRGLILNETYVLEKLGCFGKENGAGDVTVLGALYLASKYANNPILGIKVPALLTEADSDTLASVTGGLLGMLCGLEQIPVEWHIVQDFDCLVHMADVLLSENKKEASKTLIDKEKAREPDWDNSAIGLLHFIETYSITSGKNCVEIQKWKSAFGQTLYIKHIIRGEGKRENITEKKLYNAVLARIRDCLASQDNKFAFFDAKNYPVPADMLCYNRELSCFVIVELKLGVFRNEYIQAMKTYISTLDLKVKTQNEKPSVGLLICVDGTNIEIKTVLDDSLLPLTVYEIEDKLNVTRLIKEQILKMLYVHKF